ncbi:TetR/AcrR family transcriptional regulator [Formosa sp. PL04]|uniref:TetR/AcrR family transcriptional regulator n=1 Tax=Formosa sp. PL04 TaxID=3081755 RepID=UPI002980E7AA|nr:TetR/AcrR family transcriptional regulator [Formosa sp. PL04]MDW5290253.1 TetR/AcrR family transcriptional regulator [Formosa sp. PL04]
MARKVDEEKLLRIKQATMKTIVDCGIEKTTIAMIAKNANVSGGYLYRLYSGKQELINELYFDKIASLNQELDFFIGLNPTRVADILRAFIQNRIVYAQNELEASKFFYQLLHNDNFIITDQLKAETNVIIEKIKTIGVQSGEIHINSSLYEISYHFIVYVVDYIQFHRKRFFGNEPPSTINIEYLAHNILTILKK